MKHVRDEVFKSIPSFAWAAREALEGSNTPGFNKNVPEARLVIRREKEKLFHGQPMASVIWSITDDLCRQLVQANGWSHLDRLYFWAAAAEEMDPDRQIRCLDAFEGCTRCTRGVDGLRTLVEGVLSSVWDRALRARNTRGFESALRELLTRIDVSPNMAVAEMESVRKWSYAESVFVGRCQSMRRELANLRKEIACLREERDRRRQALDLEAVVRDACTHWEMPDVPKPIARLRLKNEGVIAPQEPGVYFIWADEIVVYVGEAKRLSERVHLNHENAHPGDWASWLPMCATERKRHELFYIWLLHPPRNKQGKLKRTP